MPVNVKRYIVNFAKFVTERIPLEFRFDDVIAFVNVIVSPIVAIYNKLLSFRDSILYKLTITPQVCKLEKMLNDRYDNGDRRIYIVDGSEYLPLFLFTKPELQPVFIYRKSETSKPKTFLNLKGEVSQFTFDFVVFVPVDVSFDENEMSALLNYYKLATKFFKIQTF
jgi:hypothetical protein